MHTDFQGQMDGLQQNILSRLKKIEGQVRGLQAMVAANQDCEDILVQVRAVTSALRAVSRQLLHRSLAARQLQAQQAGTNPTAALEDSLALVARFLEG